MPEKGVEQVWALGFGQQGAGHCLSEVVDRLGEEVGQRTILGRPPTLLDDVQLRRIRRQALHVYPCPRESTEQASGFLLSAEAVPDEEQRAPERPGEGLDKGKDLIAGDGGGGHRQIQPHALTHGRDGEGAGHRQTGVAVPTLVAGRLLLG